MWRPSAFAVLALSCVFWATGLGQDTDRWFTVSGSMTPEQFRQAGLHKLSAAELASLDSWYGTRLSPLLQVLSKSGDLDESARLYLENEGWDEVRVLGTVERDGNEHLKVEAGIWTYILEPRGLSTLPPGSYLGQMSYTSCEIIDHDGDVIEFWTEDTE